MDSSSSFEALGLSRPILDALAAAGYTQPTPIQASCIPLLLAQKDLMGLAQTGTGKTAAFALPLIQRIAETPKPVKSNVVRALILSPTRELAGQIYDNITAYSKHLPVKTAVIFGGVSYGPQLKALARGVDILVATPGRLIDHLDKNAVSLKSVETFILDEADRMLDMGFAPAIKRITAHLPAKRQTELFSATMPDNILSLAQKLLTNPETVIISPPTSTAENIDQSLCHVSTQAEKRPMTLRLLDELSRNNGLTLIFTRTKHGANRLADFLSKNRFPASAIHGNKSQNTRERALENFKNGSVPVLVATDIAARGIDVKNINLVINYDLPVEPDSYIHRIGRTARAGASGQAIALCSPDEAKQLRELQKHLKKRLVLHPHSGVPAPVFDDPKTSSRSSRPARAPRGRSSSRRPATTPRESRTARPARSSHGRQTSGRA